MCTGKCEGEPLPSRSRPPLGGRKKKRVGEREGEREKKGRKEGKKERQRERNKRNAFLSQVKQFPGSSMVKNRPADSRDSGDSVSIPVSGRSPGGGNDNPLQYSCLKVLRTEEPGGLHLSMSPWHHKESDTTKHAHIYESVVWSQNPGGLGKCP